MQPQVENLALAQHYNFMNSKNLIRTYRLIFLEVSEIMQKEEL